jgi:hypothetical protein
VGVNRVLPWGAVESRPEDPPHAANLEGHLEDGLAQVRARIGDGGARAPYVYRMLALSGGGSRGAFGAGVLTGMSESGNRPDFEVVTGISTGALMATFAFLGSEYDDRLRLYTRVSNADIFTPGGALRALSAPSIHDTAPMRRLIEAEFTDDVLDAVAAEHAAGRRLFVATTNLETGEFTVWDLGAIAASRRADRAERYRDVILAAAAFPIVFPPVYIPVEIDGEQYWEAHADGAAQAAVFARVFMLDVQDLLQRVDPHGEGARAELYMIWNSQPKGPTYRELRPSVPSVADRVVNTMLDSIQTYSAGELYRMALFSGVDVRMTWIPSRVEISQSPLEFDPTEMRRLFDLGRMLGRSQRAFMYATDAARDPVELLELIEPDDLFEFDTEPWERAAGM